MTQFSPENLRISNLLDYLSRQQLFAHLHSDDLTAILSRSVVNRYSTGTVLFKQGEKNQGIWLVMSGKVRIFKSVQMSKIVLPPLDKRSASVGVRERPSEIELEKPISVIKSQQKQASKQKSSSQSRHRTESGNSETSNIIEPGSLQVKTEMKESESIQIIKSATRSSYRLSQKRSASVGKSSSASQTQNKPSKSGNQINSIASQSIPSQPQSQSNVESRKPSVPRFRPEKVDVPTQISIDEYGRQE